MNITHGAPPTPTRRREYKSKYSPILDALRNAAPGEWISVPIEEVAGNNPEQKQSALYYAANNRHMRVSTTVQGDRLYVRIRPAKEAEATHA
jgi:hypothetical protein